MISDLLYNWTILLRLLRLLLLLYTEFKVQREQMDKIIVPDFVFLTDWVAAIFLSSKWLLHF